MTDPDTLRALAAELCEDGRMAKRRRCKRPDCRNPIDHKHPNAKFCGQRCKDKYWNRANPRGKYAHLNWRNHDPNDDPSWDAHK